MCLKVALVVVQLAVFWTGGNWSASASELGWQALQDGGAVVLMRHAHAPGTGDPAEFRIGDCSTQRNLASEGREQARRIGAQFASHRVRIERLLSSEWCRCLETARLAFGESVKPFPALNSFFSVRDAEEAQTRAVQALIDEWRDHTGVLVLVTHQVNITALTGVYPAEGEILVLRLKATQGFDVLDRFRP